MLGQKKKTGHEAMCLYDLVRDFGHQEDSE